MTGTAIEETRKLMKTRLAKRDSTPRHLITTVKHLLEPYGIIQHSDCLSTLHTYVSYQALHISKDTGAAPSPRYERHRLADHVRTRFDCSYRWIFVWIPDTRRLDGSPSPLRICQRFCNWIFGKGMRVTFPSSFGRILILRSKLDHALPYPSSNHPLFSVFCYSLSTCICSQNSSQCSQNVRSIAR
jgi:hypothetical protein